MPTADGLVTAAGSRRVALLDRDGTIIVDKHYLSDPEDVEFAPGALEGLRLLREAGFRLALVTNQSGVGRGYFDRGAVERVHQRLRARLAEAGIRLDAVYVCPHAPQEDCACRKPRPGMILSAMRDLDFAASEAVFIGDSDADAGAARAAGVRFVRVGGDGANFLQAATAARRLLASDEETSGCS